MVSAVQIFIALMLFIRKPFHVDAEGLQTVLFVLFFILFYFIVLLLLLLLLFYFIFFFWGGGGLFKTNPIYGSTKITAQICSVTQHPLNYVLHLTIILH